MTILLPDKPIIQYPIEPEVVDCFTPYLLNRGFDLQSKRFNLIRVGVIPLGLKISHLDGVLTAVEAYVDKRDSTVTMECRQLILYGVQFVDLLHDIGRDYPETGLRDILMANKTKRRSMYKVIHPQPPSKYDDISFWELKDYPDLGMGIAANEKGEGFIPFPPGENPIGVKVIKRNYLWFWSRPRFYNPNNPIADVVATLGPLKIFSDYQLKIIAGCLNYADNDPPELEGHQNNMLMSNLYTLLALALDQLSEQRVTDLVEVFRCVTGGGPDYV